MRVHLALIVASVLLVPVAPLKAAAQAVDSTSHSPVAPIGPPIRRIETAAAVSSELFGAVNGVRQLSDGRVLVNDGTRRRMVLMDSSLVPIGVVLDSLTEAAISYGARGAGTLLPYRGDSSLFIDLSTYSMLLLDPSGEIARVRAVPRTQDVGYLTISTAGIPGFDARGRLVYRVPVQPEPPAVAPPAGVYYIPPPPDSALVVAIDIETRKLDTLGAIRIPRRIQRPVVGADGELSSVTVPNPLPGTDDWAVVSDGSIAFLRGQDYRVEWLNPDGSWSSSEKLPFDWQRITDDDKQRMVDSMSAIEARNAVTAHVDAMIRWVNTYRKSYPPGFTVPPDFSLTHGYPREWRLPEGLEFPANYLYACPPGVEVPPQVFTAAGGPSCSFRPPGATGRVVPPPPALRRVNVISAADLPDYRPPFGPGAVRADMDGNLWIRTIPMRPTPGGAVYDVVSRGGELVDRLQVPTGYTLVGFGSGRVVYLSQRDAVGVRLVRVRLR